MIPIISIIVLLAGSAKMLYEAFAKARGCGPRCALCKKCAPKGNLG